MSERAENKLVGSIGLWFEIKFVQFFFWKKPTFAICSKTNSVRNRFPVVIYAVIRIPRRRTLGPGPTAPKHVQPGGAVADLEVLQTGGGGGNDFIA